MSDFNESDLKYKNDKYPILAFLYAIFPGGENKIYCDNREDFMNAYLTGERGKEAESILREIQSNDNSPLQPTDEQWGRLLALLQDELKAPPAPTPMW